MSAEWPAQINSQRLQPTSASMRAVLVARPTAMQDSPFLPQQRPKPPSILIASIPTKGYQAEWIWVAWKIRDGRHAKGHYRSLYYSVSKKRAPFLFLRLLSVLLTDLKNIWQCCSNWNLQQNTHFKFYIDAWCLIVNQAENTPSTDTVDIKHNAEKSDPKVSHSLRNERTAKHSKNDQIRCSNCRPLSFAQAHQLKIWSSQRMLGNDVAVFLPEFGVTHSLQQWVLAHDASSSISNSDKRYSIPKSDAFLSLVKFDLSFCDSLVHLPKNQFIDGINVVISARTARLPLHWRQCFSIFFTTYSDQKPSNLCNKIF